MSRHKRSTRRSHMRALVLVLTGSLLIAGLMIWANTRTGPGTTLETALTGEGTSVGPADAPVRVEVFSDFQCSHCKRAATDTVAPLIRDYGLTGKVKVTYRFFPKLGTESVAAAKAAICASEQGKFWPYHDKLFASWRGVQTGAFSEGRLQSFAQQIGLDTSAWSQCTGNAAVGRRIADDLADGERRGVLGTPTFFVMVAGKSLKIEGAVPYAELRRAVDAALGQHQ